MRLKKHLNEEITKQDLKQLEIILDRLFKSLNIDIEFTKHFLDRVNDRRNKKPITFGELQELFSKTYRKYANILKTLPDGTEAVLHDIQTDINVPFVLDINMGTHMIDLISKTVMRKKGFKTYNRKYNL